MKNLVLGTILSFTTLLMSGCGGSDDSTSPSESLGINSTPIDSISVVIMENNNSNGLGTTYEVYGLTNFDSSVNYNGFDSSMGTLLGSSDTNATFTDSTAYDYFAIVTDNNNRIYLDSVRGSNGKYYIPYTTSEVVFIGSNVDVEITSSGITYNYAGKADAKAGSIGKEITGSYFGGSLILDARGFYVE